ncbi:MAG: hypothetical protein HZB98_05025 [Bacteroidia bacterium]|nr:hypothetical protein [Bacteroidia bacterium]
MTPGDVGLFKIALSQSGSLKPLKEKEVKEIKTKALAGNPLFKYPRA